MNKELRDLAWSLLPKGFKEEVKVAYKRLTSTKYLQDSFGRGMKAQLETLFGHHNLTSDAEREEELLAIPRSVIQDVYRRAKRDRDKENVSPSDKDCYDSNIKLLKGLFGSNCLPDDGDNLSPEPKPAEPKYHIGQRVRHIPTRLVDVIDGISQSAPYIYHFKHMVDPINGQGIFESDLEPYTEPEASACTDDCPSQYKSQNFDNILKNSFSKERRLNVAAMAMQGILANSHQEMIDMKIDQVVKLAIEVTDALLVEVEEGGAQ